MFWFYKVINRSDLWQSVNFNDFAMNFNNFLFLLQFYAYIMVYLIFLSPCGVCVAQLLLFRTEREKRKANERVCWRKRATKTKRQSATMLKTRRRQTKKFTQTYTKHLDAMQCNVMQCNRPLCTIVCVCDPPIADNMTNASSKNEKNEKKAKT